MSVNELPKTETPIRELDPIRRLGEVIRRGRNAKGLTLEELAGKMGTTAALMSEVEHGTAVVDAKQCADLTSIIGVDYELLLECCQQWHKASWESAKGKPGFQLVEQAAKAMGVAGTDPELEKMATEVLFTGAQVAKASIKMGHDLLASCNRLQAVLIARGVLLPNPAPQPDPAEVVPPDGEETN